MADLQELFSRLRANGTPGAAASPAFQSHAPTLSQQQPSVSSPIFSPPISTPEPKSGGILSPKLSNSDDKAASLLNLLRFNAHPPAHQSPLSALQNVASAPTGSFQPETGGSASPFQERKEQTPGPAATPIPNPQQFLLDLLNKPAKAPAVSQEPGAIARPGVPDTGLTDSQQNVKRSTTPAIIASVEPTSRDATPLRVFGSQASRETTPFEAPQQSNAAPRFTYTNPFQDLTASTPKTRAPKEDDTLAASTVASVPGLPLGSQPSEAPAARSTPSAASARDLHSDPVIVKQEPKDDVPETWQTSVQESAGQTVVVYNFPMRPFVSLQLTGSQSPTPFRPTSTMDIVRLKKEFDQVDRTLVTASRSHIVYAMAKSGGFRIIRQDSGRDKQVFKSNQERIFHLQIQESSVDGSTDSILAAGVNGSVFWTSVHNGDETSFGEKDLELQGFILPPLNTVDDVTSGTTVKTRCKTSAKHPGLFAISRGKSINIIAPSKILSSAHLDKKTRLVDSAAFFASHSLKLSVGKACKDFAFSGDDTVIASLDKAGRIKFWETKECTDAADAAKGQSKVDIKVPLLSLAASISGDKVSPASIMFLDKERPCNKGIALRYLLVGFKQNHVLQLWDLGLGKAVQELELPHGDDSDAICSIAYHPKTGIITIGHPTRNTIYFVHLSAPRYHIPNMSQATYLAQLADEENNLPKPESTAIMSGIREVSFAKKGQLRSVDILQTPIIPEDASADNTPLFELYVMHSTGVTSLSITNADLGWTSDNKVVTPADAEKAGFVRISPLIAPVKPSAEAKAPATPAKEDAHKNDGLPQPPHIAQKPPVPVEKGPSPLPEGVLESIETKTPEPKKAPISEPKKAQVSEQTPSKQAATKPHVKAANTRPFGASMSAPEAVVASLPQAEPPTRPNALADRIKNQTPNGVHATTFPDANASAYIKSEFESLYKRIEDDRRVQDAAAGARQDAVLRLVSSILTENVEKSLSKIVSASMQSDVLPAVSDVFSTLADRSLAEQLRSTFGSTVPQEVRAALPQAVATAFKDGEALRLLSGPLAATLSQNVLQTLEAVVRTTIAPTISQTIAASFAKARAEAQVLEVARRAEDAAKIDRLATVISGLTGTLETMSGVMTDLQSQVAELRSQKTIVVEEVVEEPVREPTAEELELDVITALMTEGRFEEGTIKWLQSLRQAELFDDLFVRINPQYLQKLSPLVKLSVSAAVSSSFDRNVDHRLEWLGHILSSTDLNDPEIATVAPKIMTVLLARIQGAYMAVAETDPANSVLRKFSNVSRRIGELVKVMG